MKLFVFTQYSGMWKKVVGMCALVRDSLRELINEPGQGGQGEAPSRNCLPDPGCQVALNPENAHDSLIQRLI